MTKHLVFLSMLVGCGQVVADDPGVDPGDDDSPSGRCDPSQPFGEPQVVRNVVTASGLSLTGDELIAVTSDGTSLNAARRASAAGTFSIPTGDIFAGINSDSVEAGPKLQPTTTSDGLHVYYLRDIGGLFAAHTERADDGSTFDVSTALLVDGTNLTTALELAISSDGQRLYWVDTSDTRLHVADSVDPNVFANNRVVSNIDVGFIVLAPDEETIYYTPNGDDVFVAFRDSIDDSFDFGAPVEELLVPTRDLPLAATADDCVLYLFSERTGSGELMEAHRPQ